MNFHSVLVTCHVKACATLLLVQMQNSIIFRLQDTAPVAWDLPPTCLNAHISNLATFPTSSESSAKKPEARMPTPPSKCHQAKANFKSMDHSGDEQATRSTQGGPTLHFCTSHSA
mmetsp:Transcript_11848/g.21674  ORF Transcript_11848/g.21674 Transcript_11848/m.21674 type:complete len:115 (-) Transcript_11848:1105-1449(-)